MANEINNNNATPNPNEHIDINEGNYAAPKQLFRTPAPTIGKGGDALYKNIRASKEQLIELLDETTALQDWVQRKTSNDVALSCLEDQNLKEDYYKIKDGFDDYGPIMLMGFKTPQGVEIPRLKICDKNGDVIEVLTGPNAIDELSKRALAYKESHGNYEVVQPSDDEITETIADYSGNPEDYA